MKLFVSLQFCFFACILNLVPTDSVVSEADIKRKELL